MKILIIQDDAQPADALTALLGTAGYQTELAKDAILSRVWSYESNAVENHVEVYVGFLRKKLKAIGSNVKIASLRRMGYHLEMENS